MEKYKEIALDIQRIIEEKGLPQDYKLPSLLDYVAQYDVSKATVIKALESLEIRGIIYQRRGSGIYVRRQQKKNYHNLIDKFGFKNNPSNKNTSSQLLNFTEIVANKKLSKTLQVSLGTPIFYIKRLRLESDGTPTAIERSYYIKEFMPNLDASIARQSIFSYATEVVGLSLGFTDNFFEIDFLVEDDARLLNVPKSSPCLQFDSTHYLTNGKPFVASTTIYAQEHGKFCVPTSQFTTL